MTTCSECSRTERAPPSLCNLCRFWTDKLAWKDHPDVARIGGRHYVIGPADALECDRGSHGQRYVIRFADGRRVETFNLWTQGEIPERFRARLPDNATFEATP
jgi:hypothetical protein